MAPGDKPRDQRFKHLVDWVISVYTQQHDDAPVAIKNLLALVTRPNNYRSYSPDGLRDKLALNVNARTYRIVLGADVRHGDDDFRVRSLLEALLKETTSTSPYFLLCSFFTDVGSSKTRGRIKDKFHTASASRFQQMLFICAINYLASLLARHRKSPKARRGVDSPIPGLDSLKAHTPQRVGFAIQTIVVGWDLFARHLGFSSVDELVFPYARIVTPSLQFEVLPTRDAGFTPASQLKVTTLDVEPTAVREETVSRAFDFPAPVDAHLRRIARDFHDDVLEGARSSSLYTISGNTEWDRANLYKPLPTGLPSRFTEYVGQVSDEIRATTLSRSPSPARSADDDRPSPPPVEEPPRKRQRSVPVSHTPSASSPPPLLNEHAKAHVTTLSKSMQPYVRMHSGSFTDLIEIDDTLYTGQSIVENVQLVLSDPPYNVRRQSGSANSDYDFLSKDEMKDCVDHIADLLRPGGHVILFCTVQQFTIWESYFSRHMTDPETDDDDPTRTFSVDKTPLVLVKHPSMYTAFPGRFSCSLASSAEYAIHAKKQGLARAEEAAMVNYRPFNYVASTFPGFKNVITNINRLLPGEQLRVPKLDEGGNVSGSSPLRSEQKPVALMKELISRFSQPGDIVVDLFAGTFSCAVACFELPQHRSFVGIEKDDHCCSHASDHVVKRFATAIATKSTDIVLDAEGLGAASALHGLCDTPMVRDPKWCAPPGLPPYQRLPVHIVSHLASTWSKPSFLSTYLQYPIHEWDRSFQGHLQQVDVEAIRLVDAAVNGLIQCQSTIRHRNAGLGVVAARTFHKGDRVASVFGTLVYHILGTRRHRTKTYGDGVMAVDRSRFKRYAMHVSCTGPSFNSVSERFRGKPSVFIVPAPFCIAACVNDYRYDAEDEDYKAANDNALPNVRRPNVEIVQKPGVVVSPGDLLHHDFLSIHATELINPGQEIFLHYGNDIEFALPPSTSPN